ncbi:MAG: purine-nucleoside phosphorylase [Deltaproteobacteria bacterium]|nr:purine-nucleoside phosphorylase [Deltaproteobacteria bacterium]
MHSEVEPVEAAAKRLQEHLGDAPQLAIVLGSGLGPLVDKVDLEASAPFKDLLLPESMVPGHEGNAHVGTLGGSRVAVMAGRVHYYEGWTANEVVRSIRALEAWGVKKLLLTCSVGGIGEAFTPGRLALLADHLNFQNDNPLRGPVYKGLRFPDVSGAYDTDIRAALRGSAEAIGVDLLEGVYAAMNGPGYETPAEVRMLRTLGADMVGMSTVPEVMAAVALGMRVGVVAVVSNKAAGLPGSILDHRDVTEVASRAAESLSAILIGAIPQL